MDMGQGLLLSFSQIPHTMVFSNPIGIAASLGLQTPLDQMQVSIALAPHVLQFQGSHVELRPKNSLTHTTPRAAPGRDNIIQLSECPASYPTSGDSLAVPCS